ncbi:MAG: hypothetical protein OEV94_04785 [Deltaproteobacteria bacterium]|nr:hypothetical protein [Deltaproteobacteria bacterium]
MNPPHNPGEPESPLVFRLQIALLSSFVLFASGVIIWVGRLLYVSWKLNDTFSASVFIALIAVPVFSLLIGVYNYVFWGIMRGGK